MTALCGGGTSGPKFLAGATIDYSAARLAIAFENAGSAWLAELIPLLALTPLVLNTFCASDPPAVPTFTQAEANALLSVTLGADFVSGLGKLKDWALNAIWNDACQCTSGTYTPPVAPSQPAGSTITVFPSPTPVVPCTSFAGTTISNTNGQSFAIRGAIDWTHGPVVTGARVRCTQSISVGAGCDILYTVTEQQSGSVVLRTQTFTLAAATTYGELVLVPQPGTVAVWTRTDASGTGTELTQITTEGYCGGQMPGGVLTPCCPPDVATARQIAAIFDTVIAMQRNYAPFGYVVGAAHSGLTGSGSVPVSRLLGVKVVITAAPPQLGILPGNPSYVKDQGWVSVSEVDGMIQERRVSQSQFTWFPQMMPLADHINYQFFPGVTATITELKPEA